MSAGGIPFDTDLAVQGLIGAFVFFWALKDAVPLYRQMKKNAHPDPMVAAMSATWDRDMQERLLQIMERMAKAQETQADLQKNMAGSWDVMADQRQQDMNEKIELLLKALDRKEDLSAFIGKFTRP